MCVYIYIHIYIYIYICIFIYTHIITWSLHVDCYIAKLCKLQHVISLTCVLFNTGKHNFKAFRFVLQNIYKTNYVKVRICCFIFLINAVFLMTNKKNNFLGMAAMPFH